MSLSLGEKLKIRSMIYVAAEPVPFFWPMRSFIHHNPLHGLEHLPFADAVKKGSEIFHGRSFLPRSVYQGYLAEGKVDRNKLESIVAEFEADHAVEGIDLKRWLLSLLTDTESSVIARDILVDESDIYAALNGQALAPVSSEVTFGLAEQLRGQLLEDRPMYEAVDALYGCKIGDDLDELVVKSCLDFFDEGQSVWGMPKREMGFFAAWSNVARRNIRLFLRGLRIKEVLEAEDSPEGVIAHVLRTLGVPEQYWTSYFTRELARLHGWAGFIRWRATAKHYHWSQLYPGDLVDFMAVRMVLALSLLEERGRHHEAYTNGDIENIIATQTKDTYLRHEFHGRHVFPAMAHKVDKALASKDQGLVDKTFDEYVEVKRREVADDQAQRLRSLAQKAGESTELEQLSAEQVSTLVNVLHAFEKQEGMVWLRSMEEQAMGRLMDGVKLTPPVHREKRPFAQALFCIDTRSERVRRQLEGVGDYQTFGIAGFFGVPVSFMELGKGSETHLAPVIVTPKNVVLEVTTEGVSEDTAALTALEHAMHELKESVVSPFVTVEAIGLLFGLDMIGKTIAPKSYNTWRKRFHENKPSTLLLLDKLTREQADSVLRTVQRAVLIKAVEQELGFKPEQITDDMIRGLRECAMENPQETDELLRELNISEERFNQLVKRLQDGYRINPSFADLQMEQLGRIGFSVDEQANFVAGALSSIGLTNEFSRLVLVMGHGSCSDNNPYESALDCGACGGNHGLVSARVITQMANKPGVRARVRKMGIDIPEDTWFVPGLHNTTTDELKLHDLDTIPPSNLFYLDRLKSGLVSASHLAAQERLPTLQKTVPENASKAFLQAQRNSMDWSQVRPEWGLSRNCYFVIGRRDLTQQFNLDGRSFLNSYDYRVDPKRRLLESIITGPLVVGQWINMEHYFSAVDNENFGSGSKAYHNVAGRFGVMTGNLSDLRTGLPSQTVLNEGLPYHEPIRLITLIEAPFEHAQRAVEAVVSVKHLVRNGWIRLMVIDPEDGKIHIFEDGHWHNRLANTTDETLLEESSA